jgi:hypothetical protein
MIKRKIAIVCGVMLLVAALADIVASRNHRQLLPSLGVPVAQTPAEVRVNAVERKGETLDLSNAEAAKFLSRGPRRTSTEFGALQIALRRGGGFGILAVV